MRKTYTGNITKLEDNQVFVFGSNTQGRHGKGAALWALNNAGAIYGQAKGLQGQSYAIITKDLTKKVHPSISFSIINQQIRELYNLARANPHKEFFIAYRGNSINLNSYTSEEMKRMFIFDLEVPDNIIFEKEFSEL